MRTSRVIPLFALLVAAACGGGKIDSHEEGVEAVNDVADDMVKVLGTVKDKKSAEAAKPKIEALDKKLNDIQAQMQKLGPMTDPKIAQKMGEAMQKIMEAMAKVPNDPDVHQVLGSINMGSGR